MAKNLKLMFLGGVGEIGKNMTVLEFNNQIVVIDAGLAFPNSEEMPGIDYVIPDFSYLVQNKEKVKGIVITHGHEDHIGAIPYLLQEVSAPVYGSNLAIALLESKVAEKKMSNLTLKVVDDRTVVNVGCFSIEFIRVTHSIAGAFALSIDTPKGKIFHTGDFKIDHTPIDGRNTDLARIAEIGSKGVLLLLQDSTNAERAGYSMSERSVGQSLDAIFAKNTTKRLIVATFASNIHRVQQIINCALKYDRRIVFSGRSMEKIAKIAHKLKEVNFPPEKIVDIEKMDGIPYDKICIISTGTQGEPESALTRMSQNEFRTVRISELDTVVLSASPIPGNEKPIYSVINNLYRMGAQVVYKSLEEVHVSGHACQEELKLMMALIKPKYFIPVHGEYRHLKQHAELAINMGVPAANITIPELGTVIDVSRSGLKKCEPVHSGIVLLDGSIVENADLMLKDRKLLAEDGFVIAIVSVSNIGALMSPPIIITRGINITEALVEELKDAIVQRFQGNDNAGLEPTDVRAVIRKVVAKVLFKRLNKRPMIIPVTIE